MADDAILKSIEQHMSRGNELMAEMRDAYGQQLELTRAVIQRNAEAFVGLMTALDRFGERIDAFGERIDEFGDTLALQREILLRFLDRLDEGTPPPQG